MVNYKSKYLEYKLKYINTKNKQKGGYIYEKKINEEEKEQDGGIVISGPLALGALAVKGAMAAKAALAGVGAAKAIAATGTALTVANQAADLHNKVKEGQEYYDEEDEEYYDEEDEEYYDEEEEYDN